MKDDRLRIPVENAYVEVLGRAAYVFSSVEWNAAHCCERMHDWMRLKKLKRKRGPRMTFGELVQKLWQPEPKRLEPKVAKAKHKKSTGKSNRVRKRSRSRPT